MLAAFITQAALQIRTARVVVEEIPAALEALLAVMEASTEAAVELAVTMKTTGMTLIITETFMS